MGREPPDGANRGYGGGGAAPSGPQQKDNRTSRGPEQLFWLSCEQLRADSGSLKQPSASLSSFLQA
eukprot:10930289-Alexandrium_andersonii.AAC.1